MADRTPPPGAVTGWTCWQCQRDVPASNKTCPCQRGKSAAPAGHVLAVAGGGWL